VLEVEGIHASRGRIQVLQGIDLQVAEAECTTVLGRNGMGKTTLIRVLMGLTPVQTGRVVLDGEEIGALPPHARARRGLALVPQGRHLFPSLTVEENLTLTAGKQAEGAGWSLARVYDLFPGLLGRRKHRGSELSGGEQQMVAIGRALMTNPRFLLMDEPSEGLAPLLVERLRNVVETLREQRLGILLVEQNYRLGVDLADRVVVLAKGQVAWSGSPVALEAADAIRHVHLGV
jgi:branched-chain amino acid transport system ATP-binding protein